MTTPTPHSTDTHEGTTMTENPTPATTAPDARPEPDQPPAARRTLRDRLPRHLPSGRKAVAAGAVVAGLAIGGAGFGAGYAVADDGGSDTATQTTDDWTQRGYPGDGRGPMGEMPGGGMDGQMGGTTGEPDFDGDGKPDTDSGTDTDSSDSSTQNS
jgi:hypothetical protein